MEDKKQTWSPHHPPGTIIQASDRQYRVSESGAWKRIPKYAEIIGVPPVVEPMPFHVGLRDARTGVKCWCNECLQKRREM